MIYEKTCKHCQKKFESKRRDTKFCSPNCRSGYSYWKKNPKKESKKYVFKDERQVVKEDGGTIEKEVVLQEITPKPWREHWYWKRVKERFGKYGWSDEMIDAYYALNIDHINREMDALERNN